MKKTLLGECLAEFIGTFIFLFIGLGAVVSLVAGGSDITWAELTLTWGFAVKLIVPFYPAIPAVVLSAKDQDQLAS